MSYIFCPKFGQNRCSPCFMSEPRFIVGVRANVEELFYEMSPAQHAADKLQLNYKICVDATIQSYCTALYYYGSALLQSAPRRSAFFF